MSYKFVIAEKPSVAQSIAKVIGADKREAEIEGFKPEPIYKLSISCGNITEKAC